MESSDPGTYLMLIYRDAKAKFVAPTLSSLNTTFSQDIG